MSLCDLKFLSLEHQCMKGFTCRTYKVPTEDLDVKKKSREREGGKIIADFVQVEQKFTTSCFHKTTYANMFLEYLNIFLLPPTLILAYYQISLIGSQIKQILRMCVKVLLLPGHKVQWKY